MIEQNRVAYGYLEKIIYDMEKDLEDMEALNFYAKDKSFRKNCAEDALKKIERVGKKHGLSNNH